MLEKIRHTVRKFEMVNPGEHIIAAVSGGPDSVALLQALVLLSSEYDLSLTVAHLNHGLRGAESDAEEELVRQLSQGRGIPCAVKRVDLMALRNRGKRKRSLEDIGREERYQFFTTLAAEVGASRIALGHHREDQAETVLMNLIRGSGLEGLKGILPVRDGCFIRPLLEISRKEILHFLKIRHLPFLEDSSNGQDFFLRNRIRNQLIPLLQEQYNPQIVNTLNRIAGIARREDVCLKSAAGQILDTWQIPSLREGGEKTAIEISKVLILPEALQFRVIKILLERCVVSPHRVVSAHIQAVLDLCLGQKHDGVVFLPGNAMVKREQEKLTFVLKDAECLAELSSSGKGRSFENYFYPVNIPDFMEIKEAGRIVRTSFIEPDVVRTFGGEKKTAYFDLEKVQMPLVIRNRRDGDRFQPLGMAGTKKLKAYFIDEKIPRQQRNLIPLLTDRNSVVWVAGLRLSERVRVDHKTRRMVKIEII